MLSKRLMKTMILKNVMIGTLTKMSFAERGLIVNFETATIIVYYMLGAYTFCSVRWATQKGDILGVRAQKVARLRGGQICVFRACVAQLVWPSSKYRWGGQHYIFFESSKLPKTVFTCVLQ